MFVPFRQGIVKCPVANNVQQFLTKTSTTISIVTSAGPTLFSIAHKNSTYLHVESTPTINAWTIPAASTYYLFIDINIRTALRTFGTVTKTPTVATTAPTVKAVNDMWFDKTTSTMKYYNGTGWVECIRVLVAKVIAGVIHPWNAGSSYLGTQINDYTETNTGHIAYDADDRPLKRTSTFFTTTDTITANTNTISSIRLEALQFYAYAEQHMPQYTVVQLSQFGAITPAGTNNTYDSAIGIIETPLEIGQYGAVTPSGVIQNANWNWPTPNQPLYYDEAGQLTIIARPGIQPIAYAVESDKILFNSKTGSSSTIVSTRNSNVQSYNNASGTLLLDTNISWHTIKQNGPLTISFTRPAVDYLVKFNVEIISNGSPINWGTAGGSRSIPLNVTEIYSITFRPAREGIDAAFFRSIETF
jgi:hypothetical protein